MSRYPQTTHVINRPPPMSSSMLALRNIVKETFPRPRIISSGSYGFSKETLKLTMRRQTLNRDDVSPFSTWPVVVRVPTGGSLGHDVFAAHKLLSVSSDRGSIFSPFKTQFKETGELLIKIFRLVSFRQNCTRHRRKRFLHERSGRY